MTTATRGSRCWPCASCPCMVRCGPAGGHLSYRRNQVLAAYLLEQVARHAGLDGGDQCLLVRGRAVLSRGDASSTMCGLLPSWWH